MERSLGKLPRGPLEWGEVLWQEGWAFEKRTPGGVWDWVLPIILGPMSIVFLLFVFLDFLLSEDVDDISIMIGISMFLFLFITFIWITIYLLRMWPRRIYEKGITYPKQTIFGYRPEVECFIPYEQLKSIHMEEANKDGVGLIVILKLVVVDEGEERIIKMHDEPGDLIVEWVDIFLSQHPEIERGNYTGLDNKASHSSETR